MIGYFIDRVVIFKRCLQTLTGPPRRRINCKTLFRFSTLGCFDDSFTAFDLLNILHANRILEVPSPNNNNRINNKLAKNILRG